MASSKSWIGTGINLACARNCNNYNYRIAFGIETPDFVVECRHP
jgi:hypothetical protein